MPVHLHLQKLVAMMVWIALSWLACPISGEISSGRIKGDDEPHIVSWRVLEGVTEPFESNQRDIVPVWKQMKNAADHKAASMAVQQALHEYGQLLRHPYMFGEMPMEERYDVFLSMSKLLKVMGFHQRAELLLYEAMSYTINPHEAHLQLGLLFLDKEDIDKAKVHLKNCLFFKEKDLLILIHLSVILIAEGRIHEAKFFLSRILQGLEARVRTLSFMISEQEMQSLTGQIDYKVLSTWVEDLIVKVLYGEFRFTASSTMEMLRLFSNLYQWVSAGEMAGRFVFDLGQSLYEGGRPRIGQMMMIRGFETSDVEMEGEVSSYVVNMRLALDYPVVPESILQILESYLNMTNYLSSTSSSYVAIDFENIVDIYWPLPLLAWSGLPVMPVLTELMWRFEGGPVRSDRLSQFWLNASTYDQIIDEYHPQQDVLTALLQASTTTAAAAMESQQRRRGRQFSKRQQSQRQTQSINDDEETFEEDEEEEEDLTQYVKTFDEVSQLNQKVVDGVRTIVIPPPPSQLDRSDPTTSTSSGSHPTANVGAVSAQNRAGFHHHLSSGGASSDGSGATAAGPKVKVEVGILGGHMNAHPVGQMIFRRLLGLAMPPTAVSGSRGKSSTHRRDGNDGDDDGNDGNDTSNSSGVRRVEVDWREVINLTLLAMPLIPDMVTKRIASTVHRIVNLPMDTPAAWRLIENLHLDILVVPDWQPFPDQQAPFFQSRRLAPVQVCLFVRGTSCAAAAGAIDYYLMPEELHPTYLASTPAAGAFSTVNVTRAPSTATAAATNTGRGGSGGGGGGGGVGGGSVIRRPLRPQWREFFAEQVVLLDWPLLTPRVVQGIAGTVPPSTASSSTSSTSTSSSTSSSTGASPSAGTTGGGGTSPSYSSRPSPTTVHSTARAGGRVIGFEGADDLSAAASTGNSGLYDLQNLASNTPFSPLDIEGKVFFEGQPVAVLPLHPTYFHPLMDDVIFKIMRSVPSLQVVIALPDSFFTHSHDVKHKISWARKLVRRLWTRGGALFHRIRLLPAPLNDERMVALLRQADVVLDSFPLGNSFYFLGMALSVGTPIITLAAGTDLQSSKEDLKELRLYLSQQRHKQRQLQQEQQKRYQEQQKSSSGTGSGTGSGENGGVGSNASTTGGGAGGNTGNVRMDQPHYTQLNPMSQYVSHFDMPWQPAISAVAAFYSSVGLQQYFVANSSAEYFRLAVDLTTDREFAYGLRVKLLDAIDGSSSAASSGHSTTAVVDATTTTAAAAAAAGRGKQDEKDLDEEWDEFAAAEEEEQKTRARAAIKQNSPKKTWGGSGAQSDKDTAGDAGGARVASVVTSTASVSGTPDALLCGHCVHDLGRFFLSVGVPYSRARVSTAWKMQQQRQQHQQHNRSGGADGADSSGSASGKSKRKQSTSSSSSSSSIHSPATAATGSNQGQQQQSKVTYDFDGHNDHHGSGAIS